MQIYLYVQWLLGKFSTLTMKGLYAKQEVTQNFTEIRSVSQRKRENSSFSSVSLCVFSVSLCVTFLVLTCLNYGNLENLRPICFGEEQTCLH